MKRKHDDKWMVESIAKIFAAADKHAAEREESMRKFEMEMEERRAEREDKTRGTDDATAYQVYAPNNRWPWLHAWASSPACNEFSPTQQIILL